MQDDSEALQRKFLKLLQDLIPTASQADAEAVSQELIEWKGDRPISPNESFQGSSGTPGHYAPKNLPLERETLFELGEIPAVQDRFYSLLKHRLSSEIEQNPPLFPWETEIYDYEAESAPYGVASFDEAVTASVSTGRQKSPVEIWLTQLKNVSLPIPLPETILTQLLQRCQEIAHSTLLDGAKLVQAVEELFPGQAQALNQLAGVVMTAPARSGAVTSTPGSNFPASYEAAAPAQQMVLSLLAAREIITSLTLTVSSSQPTVERQWLTESGLLTLKAEYEPHSTASKLRIQGDFPGSGSLVLRGDGLQASAERSTPGFLSVELFDLRFKHPHILEVRLNEEEPPLVFTVRIAEG